MDSYLGIKGLRRRMNKYIVCTLSSNFMVAVDGLLVEENDSTDDHHVDEEIKIQPSPKEATHTDRTIRDDNTC